MQPLKTRRPADGRWGSECPRPCDHTNQQREYIEPQNASFRSCSVITESLWFCRNRLPPCQSNQRLLIKRLRCATPGQVPQRVGARTFSEGLRRVFEQIEGLLN